MHAASAAHRMFLSDVSFGCKSTRALSDQRPSRRKLEQRESEGVESLDMFRIFWKFRSFYCWCNRRQTLLNRLHTHKYICISFHDFTTSHRRCLSDVSEVLLRRFLPSKPDKPVIVKAVKSLEDALEALEAVEAGSAQLFWCELSSNLR